MTENNQDHTLENGAPEVIGGEDIFSRPSGFRIGAVKAVWEKAPPGPEANTRYDWRNGVVVGPWQYGQSRDGIWDMGHIVAWYKVVDELKKVDGITRTDVIDEFNNIDNLGVEDPVTNRELGTNSRVLNVHRLSESHAEEIIFGHPQAALTAEEYRAEVDAKEEHMKTRIQKLAEGKKAMSAYHASENRADERLIIWDTETTGLSPKTGEKLVDIAAVEFINGKPSGREYHEIINPGIHIPSSATRVHGISDETVKGKPAFGEIAQSFLDFIGDAKMVAHNARFDMSFLNAELEAAGKLPVAKERAIDSLKVARTLLPDLGKYDLDALADHLGVDRSSRNDHHGALICSKVLADVFIKLEEIAKEKGIPLHTGAGEETDTVEQDQQQLNQARVIQREMTQLRKSFVQRAEEIKQTGNAIAR